MILRANKPKWYNGLNIMTATLEGMVRWVTQNVPNSPARARLIDALERAHREARGALR